MLSLTLKFSEMSSFFSKSGFPPCCYKWIPHPCLLCKTFVLLPPDRTRIVFLIITFHSISLCIQHIILWQFRHLQRDLTASHIFLSPPLSVFQRLLPPYLVHLPIQQTTLSPATFPCNQCRGWMRNVCSESININILTIRIVIADICKMWSSLELKMTLPSLFCIHYLLYPTRLTHWLCNFAFPKNVFFRWLIGLHAFSFHCFRMQIAERFLDGML